MLRRGVLQGGAASLAAAAFAAWLPARAATKRRKSSNRSTGLKPLGSARPFDYAHLKGMARTLSAAPYQSRAGRLPPAVAHLDWDHWEAIRYRASHNVWAGDGLAYQVGFMHLGFQVLKPVRMYTVENGHAQEIAYDPAMWDYSRAGLKASELPADLGFGGFRIFYHTDWIRDVAVFQGASYFRAVDGDLQYGMSHRGLAIDTGMPRPEEFPDFVAFYLERPEKGSNLLTVYALLDSPSVAGAYRFVISVGDTLTMDVDAALYPRTEIERLGIAPGTSMFYKGENQRNVSEDWRPQIHDSDGLQIFTGGGEWIWRPLINPKVVRVNTFVDDGPRGFGLMQRDRSFSNYQDDGVFYDKRPSVWVEPKGNWGKGAVMLVELPTPDETMDNIVAFWNPERKPQRGEELLYAYRLYWSRSNPIGPKRLATTGATRTGIGGIIGQPRKYFSWRFVIDFFGGDLPLLTDVDKVTPVISASRGRVEITSARPLKPLNGWRAMFDLVPDASTDPIDLRLYLSYQGQPLTETWIYQYTPPPVGERKY